jgi:glycosyltransferase involved in cell wall biosynthesis
MADFVARGGDPDRVRARRRSDARSGTGAPPLRRWTLNGDFVCLAPTGVARYAREVTVALDALVARGHVLTRDLDLDVVVPGAGRDPLALGTLPVRIVPEYARPRLPQAWVQLQLPRHVPGGLVSFCNLAPVWPTRHIACIHDLHTRLIPESYGRGFVFAHRIILPLLGRRAAAITTVSEFSRQHLAEFGVAPSAKVTVTYNGADHARRWNPGRGTLAPPGRPYVLCLGRTQKYKNLELVLRLAPILDARGLDLWMAGDVERSRLGEAVPENVRLLGRIDDDDLAQALTEARAFLFPSRIEGFGLPAVEAMASGCPVVASTAPCLPEICGDAALYADPDDAAGWIAAIDRLHTEPETRRAMIAAGLARAERYSWERIAEHYLRLMLEVDIAADAAARR